MEYLVGSGILRRNQLDDQADGSSVRFFQSRGRITQAGFATSEPYRYSHAPGWGRELKYALVNDTGYPFYPHALSIRAADKDKLAPCLRRLVPIVQRAQIDFLNHPDRTNAFIVHLVAKYHDPSWTYPPGLADYAITQLRLNFVNNGADQSWATSRPTGSSTWSTSSRRSWPASASPTSRASSPRTCTPTSTSTPASACRRPDRRGRGGG